MNIQKLKEMIREPAGKEWFAKHGLPKGMGPKSKAIQKEKIDYPHAKMLTRKQGIEMSRNQGESPHNARRTEIIRSQLKRERK